MSVSSSSFSFSTSLLSNEGLVRHSARISRTLFIQGVVIRAWNNIASGVLRKLIAAPMDSKESAIFSGRSFRDPRIKSLVASSAIPCWLLGSVAVPARMLPWTATVGLSVVRYSRHLTPLAIECSSTSLGRSESMPMVVPHTYGPANCPVLDRQIFPGDFRDLLSSYPRQLLDQLRHRLKRDDEFEDSNYKSLSSNTVKRV